MSRHTITGRHPELVVTGRSIRCGDSAKPDEPPVLKRVASPRLRVQLNAGYRLVPSAQDFARKRRAMDLVTGLFLGGVSRCVVRDIDRAARAATGVFSDSSLAEQNRALYELAIHWQSCAERLEAENAQLRADVAAIRSRQPGA